MATKRIKQQYGALPFRWRDDGEVEVLLITSRETGRWVIPKGWPMKGKKPYGAASQEAWEEAGVIGKIAKKPLGHFNYDKMLSGGETLPCRVDVYALAVELTDFAWPEFGERRRSWMMADEAAALVNEKALARIISAFGVAGVDAGLRRKKAAA